MTVIITIISCEENNQDSMITKRPKTSKAWGFFRGTINEYKFDLYNHWPSDADSIRSIRQAIYYKNSLGYDSIGYDSVNYILTGIQLPNAARISVHIRNLALGKKKVSSSPFLENNESYIKVSVDQTEYCKTRKSNPFLVEIIGVEWESQDDPIMEVKINGYLFVNSNTNDSIYIDAIYGTR